MELRQREDLATVMARLGQTTSSLRARGGGPDGDPGDTQLTREMLADLSAAVAHLRQVASDSGARLSSVMTALSALRAEADRAPEALARSGDLAELEKAAVIAAPDPEPRWPDTAPALPSQAVLEEIRALRAELGSAERVHLQAFIDEIRTVRVGLDPAERYWPIRHAVVHALRRPASGRFETTT